MAFLKSFGSFFGDEKKEPPNVPNTPPPTPAQSLTITRIFDVGRHKVWEMWTKPEKIIEWWGVPPIAATAETTKIDLRPGGKWQADLLHQADGVVMPFRGTYVTVDPPRKLVFTIENPGDPTNSQVEMVTVTFADKAGTTQMTMQQTGNLPADQYQGPLLQGYSAFFDRMAKYLRLHQD